MTRQRRPFLVNVAALRHRPGSSQREQRSGTLAGLAMPASRVSPVAEVAVDALLESASGGIVVLARVVAPWEAECRRCLGQARGELALEVRELYSDRGDPELSYPLPGDRLDLEPLVRDAVLLELPQVPLCRPDCAGLCPTCGADRNEAGCSCGEVARDLRRVALDGLV
ncbi:MAG: YceD family protein [Acidimicrobiales bacterium]